MIAIKWKYNKYLRLTKRLVIHLAELIFEWNQLKTSLCCNFTASEISLYWSYLMKRILVTSTICLLIFSDFLKANELDTLITFSEKPVQLQFFANCYSRLWSKIKRPQTPNFPKKKFRVQWRYKDIKVPLWNSIWKI